MFYVGIDIAKSSHVACVMREDNTLEIAYQKIKQYSSSFYEHY